jgi:hypothetical protein
MAQGAVFHAIVSFAKFHASLFIERVWLPSVGSGLL